MGDEIAAVTLTKLDDTIDTANLYRAVSVKMNDEIWAQGAPCRLLRKTSTTKQLAPMAPDGVQNRLEGHHAMHAQLGS
jgi:hypothetical protein